MYILCVCDGSVHLARVHHWCTRASQRHRDTPLCLCVSVTQVYTNGVHAQASGAGYIVCMFVSREKFESLSENFWRHLQEISLENELYSQFMVYDAGYIVCVFISREKFDQS